jgi:ABC-type branched-subunit amino acid transport system permease subunit
LILCLNLLRGRTGRAWQAIRAHEAVAEALGISIASYKLLAFVISSAITAVAGRCSPIIAASFRSRRSRCSSPSNMAR